MFEIYLNIAIGLTLVYVILIRLYVRGWRHLPMFRLPENYAPKTKISLIIPARNEAENIPRLLQSIENQLISKDLLEVIIIDDHSEDETARLVEKSNLPNIRLLKATNKGKKNAIHQAIQQATGDLIVQTDADCILLPNWLLYISAYYEAKKPKFIAAPVAFQEEKNTLERFQSLDFMGMMCVTGAGINTGFMRMCNGANLAYEKKAFEFVGGFQGNEQIASGDDMFLLHKMARMWPNKIGFLKNQEATVFTNAKPNLNSFIAQRLRWATKNASYSEWQVTAILALVFFFCWSIIISFLSIPFVGRSAILLFFGQLLLKAIVDYGFLGEMARWFRREDLLSSFWSAQMMHILYIAGIGIWSNFKKKYEWKGREVN